MLPNENISLSTLHVCKEEVSLKNKIKKNSNISEETRWFRSNSRNSRTKHCSCEKETTFTFTFCFIYNLLRS